jgi:cyclophilin family peptidyl-prolyl cis-trans isomerase
MTQRQFVVVVVSAMAALLAGAPTTAEQATAAKPGAAQPAAAKPGAAPIIVLETVKGTVEIETFPADAPKSVAKIVALARKNFYRGMRVHWEQPGVIQFGDPATRNMARTDRWGFGGSGQKIGVKEISKRSFGRGIVGFAYPADGRPEEADSQMFILRIANPALNGKYAAIGRVVKGMDVVDKIQLYDVIKTVTVR